jgi:anaerobic magnesium-protoporphyrin IX monomethyl ester cyclase
MKVLLIQPIAYTPGYSFFNPEKASNIGLLYIASMAERFGCDVAIDFATGYNLEGVLSRHSPDIVGFSCSTAQSPLVKEFIKRTKEFDKSVKVIVGGHHATFRDREILIDSPADVVVRGEGDLTFLDLLKFFKEGTPKLKNIAGISFVKNKRIVVNQQRPLISNLDSLPFPARHLLDFKYERISTSRGCPFSCKFCSISSFYGSTWRARSVDSVIKEIETMLDLKIRNLSIIDDNFFTNPKRVVEICKKIIEHGFDIRFKVEGSINILDKHPEMLDVLCEAGCEVIALGLESGVQDILDSYNKKLTIEQIKSVAKMLEDYDICKVWLAIVGSGDKFDSPEYIRKHVDFLLSIPYDIIQISILTPFPGTQLFTELEKEGRILTYDWKKYDCCHCVYRPLNMSPEQLENMWLDTIKEMFTNGGWIKSIKRYMKILKITRLSPMRALSLISTAVQFWLSGMKEKEIFFEAEKKKFEKRVRKNYS